MTEQQTHDASWYLDNWTPAQVAEFAAAHEAEVVALTAGAEPYDDERVVPTPGQWITLFNRATPVQRLAMAEKAIADADHQYECHMKAWPERAREAEAELASIRKQRWGVRASGCGQACSEQHTYADGCEVKVTARYVGGQPPQCEACGKVRHLGSTCEEAAAGRHPLVERFAREVDRALREACDHRDPNRLGHRPGDLALVCACGEMVFPLPRPFGPSGAASYAEQVNAPLRPETVAAIARYAGTDFQLLRDHEEQSITDGLTAAGFHVVRTEPTEEVAVNMATLGRLRSTLAEAEQDPWAPAPIGSMSGWNVIVDAAVPDGEVRFRPRQPAQDLP